MSRRWTAVALTALVLVLLARAPVEGQVFPTTTTTTEPSSSTTTESTTTTFLPIPTTNRTTTTTEPAVTTSSRPSSSTSTTRRSSTTTSTTDSGDSDETPPTTAFATTTSLPGSGKSGSDGLSTDTLVRLLIGALLLIAIVLAGITWWIWRATDPRARAER
ncbi:MAG: hypothetical protein QOD30_1375 [Actinomycetota bacterium]|nr:hypothetical protein [Actinomycetota bacterium]